MYCGVYFVIPFYFKGEKKIFLFIVIFHLDLKEETICIVTDFKVNHTCDIVQSCLVSVNKLEQEYPYQNHFLSTIKSNTRLLKIGKPSGCYLVIMNPISPHLSSIWWGATRM